jgi:anti-sigma B factor antagonist
MELKLSQAGNVKIISLSGKYDIESTEEFERIFNSQIDGKSLTIAVDMSNLQYIDSSGIGSLIKCLNNLKSKNGKLLLVDLKPMILNVFKLAKLDLFFEILTKMEFQTRYLDDDDLDDLN